MRQLCFLEIGDYPDIRQWREGRDLSADPDQLPGFDLTQSDHAVLGRGNRCVPEVDPGQIARGALRSGGRLALPELCREDGEFAFRRADLCPVLRELRLELIVSGRELLARLDRG